MKLIQFMTEAELSDYMRGCADAIGVASAQRLVEKPLFVLLVFNDPGSVQYISNCRRESMIDALRSAAKRLESREDVAR